MLKEDAHDVRAVGSCAGVESLAFGSARIFVVGDNAEQARAVAEAIVEDAFHNVSFYAGSASDLD